MITKDERLMSRRGLDFGVELAGGVGLVGGRYEVCFDTRIDQAAFFFGGG
jgi:hypothetical protein